jgi:hypothetical protein
MLAKRPILVVLLMILTAPILARAQESSSEFYLSVKAVKGVNDRIAFNRFLYITVDNLETWLKQPGHDASKFSLVIGGHVIKGLPPPFVTQNSLGFYLKRTPESKNEWKSIMKRILDESDRPVGITVRHEDVKVKNYVKATLNLFDRQWLIVFLVSIVVSAVLFCYLAYKTDIVRETGEQPKGKDEYGRPNRKPYSLARTQMAFWFFVVVGSYFFIWMTTDDIASLTPSVLGLIGISAATGLSSAVVDSSKRDSLQNKLGRMEREVAQDPSAAPQESGETIKDLRKKMAIPKSQGIIDDILSDYDGVSFHRFQLLGWTAVLIVIFITSVWSNLAMPDFDPTLLGLMGISGGTYIGFKLPNAQG